MLQIGKFQELRIDRETGSGLFLQGTEEEDQVLLPGKFMPQQFEIGDIIKVFIYLDNEGRPISTTQEPFLQRDDFGYLYCSEATKVGAFMDIGIDKELLIPFSNQSRSLEAGDWAVTYMYLDEKTNRLVGTTRFTNILSNEHVEVQRGDKVDLMVSHFSDLGANVIINKKHNGLIYKDQIFEDLREGDKLPGYIKRVRGDGKIDVLLSPEGYKSIEPNANYLYEELMANDGFLPLHDKSEPDKIQEYLGISKKSFKKAVGALYKDRKIELTPKGIQLKD